MNFYHGIYLGAYRAFHNDFLIDYQDINGKRDIGGDMLDIDLSTYDYIICTPPCNFYSRANYRRYESEYALKTMCLLPIMLRRLINLGKPFIIENVQNRNLMQQFKLLDLPGCNVYFVGRHTYWSNVVLDLEGINQVAKTDFVNGKKRYLSSQNLPRYLRQGGEEVHQVIQKFLCTIHYENYLITRSDSLPLYS